MFASVLSQHLGATRSTEFWIKSLAACSPACVWMLVEVFQLEEAVFSPHCPSKFGSLLAVFEKELICRMTSQSKNPKRFPTHRGRKCVQNSDHGSGEEG